jgi:hypothetical protein
MAREYARGMTDTPPVLLEADSRRRISLGSLVEEHARYLATVEGDGVIILTPAAVIEAAALRDPLVMAAVREARAGDRTQLRQRPLATS